MTDEQYSDKRLKEVYDYLLKETGFLAAVDVPFDVIKALKAKLKQKETAAGDLVKTHQTVIDSLEAENKYLRGKNKSEIEENQRLNEILRFNE